MKNKIFTFTLLLLTGFFIGVVLTSVSNSKTKNQLLKKQNMVVQLEENLNEKNIELENIQQQAAPYLNLIELNNQISDLDGKKDRLVEVKTELQNNLHILIGE